MTRPRKQLYFPAIQTESDLNYIPKPTRDETKRALFRSMPHGFVIVHNQRIGIKGGTEALQRAVYEGDPRNVRDLTRVLATAAFGTAYHLYAEDMMFLDDPSQLKMYRQVVLPELQDAETGEEIPKEKQMEAALTGLVGASRLARKIEEEHAIGNIDHTQDNYDLGVALTHQGARLSVLAGNVSGRGDELRVRANALIAAGKGMVGMLELSGRIGSRPTFAQLGDEQSPWRRYLHDEQAVISQRAHKILLEEIEEASAA
ncbi:MAG TPA: hypothetical protein PL051_00120 [Candidatus Saccharibacteria bacterium]|nr:hypothetical protein [Candidatus Saccharibacteria bacterium]